ncbi:hypothetical protein D0Z07_6467 [Hyphodiscus hymeniophilus]|uniref:Cytochrome b561 domain-containing protein n=1 Tax=Hyphodiscus hymeniophilus TaxID=353542 RepID=A0A9P6VFF0_9HELO|nr:hypothetical protein D0Z07_6467 [Hyphodiscus hymeniophilus]
MAPAPLDNLSPPGSSTYSSNTLYVGDGTWDATKNDFLLPNLVGFNYDTTRYNGMGNRFSALPGYKSLIKGHGIVAAITFLFIVPTAIMTARFYGRNPGFALRFHIYLQILTVLLSTVVFILGFQAVGPARSLTNPHHGIGVAIYVLIWVQFLLGWWSNRRRERGRAVYRVPMKLYLHQWLGRVTALLGIAQVPLGLTLYGSPKWTFVVYTLWMSFLLLLYFIFSYRATRTIGGMNRTESVHTGTVIEERRRGRFGGWLGPLAAGAGGAWLLNRNRRNKERSRSRARTEEVIPSRRGSRRGSRRDSGSFIEEEKYEGRRREGGGLFDTLLKGAAVFGAAGLAKSWYDRRQQKKQGDDYTSVAPDTPSRRHRPRRDSISEDSLSVHRTEQGRLASGSRRSNLLPGPGDPALAAAAISAAQSRPVTPRPVHGRVQSFDSGSYSYDDSTLSPSRRPRTPPNHNIRNGLAAGLGLAWVAKKFRDRRERKEQDRIVEEERIQREEGRKFTGDGSPAARRHGRRASRTESSELSSVIDDPHHIRPGAIPPIPVALGGAAAGAAMSQSRSRHDITEQIVMPPAPPDPQGILHQESGSEQYFSSGGAPHRRHSSRRRREGEEAAAAAVAGAAGLAAEEEMQRRRSRSRHTQSEAVASPPVSVKVKMHGDRDRNVTLRRLTEEEAAAEREARRGHRRRRADSMSSLSGTDTATSRRRYRRDDREQREADEIAAEKRAEAGAPPIMTSLSPPNPAFAGGRRPKDSAYYSGRPGSAGVAGPSGYPASSGVGGGSVGSPESHGTWSGVSPGSAKGSEDAAERRRRRRLERNRERGPGSGTVDFT